MRKMATARRIETKQAPACGQEHALGDLRFRSLLSAEQWRILPEAVRQRFSKRLSGGATAIYVGRVTDFRISRLGRFLAQALRVIGAPLPVFDDVDVPTVVSVTEDVATGGQIWSRMYCNRRGFPQVIHSSKQFSGPTGLEEYVGFGVSMLLRVAAEPKGLCFSSAGYAFRLGSYRLPIPKLLVPGELTVTHRETASDSFMFEMTLRHPLFGELIHQAAEYRDGVA
jgi:Domain of unknown function (DUF4166)